MDLPENNPSWDSVLIDLLARVGVMEFAVQMVIANSLALSSPAGSEAFKAAIVKHFSNPGFPAVWGNEQMEAHLDARTRAVLKEFIATLTLAEMAIRRELERHQSPGAADAPQPDCGGPATDR